MKRAHRFLVAASAIGSLAVLASVNAQAACTRVSAQGEGLTKELAQEVAKMNLEFTVAAKGAKSSGAVAMKCGAPGPLLFTSCTARQRACS